MQIHLRSRRDVRLFCLTITLVSMVSSAIMQVLFIPSDLIWEILPRGLWITMIVTIPISYFVGLKMWQNHRLSMALEHAAAHDLLTNTATRMSFYKQLKDAGEGPFALMIIDIDHFKSINDEFGHHVGDTALKHFSLTLMRNSREDDILARFGGEEFVLVLRDANLTDGITAAERLCRCIANKPLTLPHNMLNMTASFGVTELTRKNDVDAALKRADLALYRAKTTGRNRVCAFDPTIDLKTVNSTAAE